MAAYRRVYDSRHLQAGCQEPRSAPGNPTLGNRMWATFTFTFCLLRSTEIAEYKVYKLETIQARQLICLSVYCSDCMHG